MNPQSESLIGCCGWAGSQPQYFSQFPVIEIQSTFYDPPGFESCGPLAYDFSAGV